MRIIKTREKEFKKLSKLKVGDTPLTGSIIFVVGSTLHSYAKRSRASKEQMKMHRMRKAVKSTTSPRDFPRVSNKRSNLFHYLASLNILSNLNPLNVVLILPLELYVSYDKTNDSIKSTKLATTLMQSKQFRGYPLK